MQKFFLNIYAIFYKSFTRRFFMISIKNIVFGIAIIVLTMFVTVYGINTFYSEPEYSDFCSEGRPFPKLVDGEDRICPAVCVQMYEIKNSACVFNSCGSGCGPDSINSFDTLAQCEIVSSGKNCYKLLDEANKVYSRNVFLIALPLGILIIVLGAYLFSLEAVGVGLMAGGAGTLIYGSGGYWRYADNWLKFVLSLVGLVALIIFAYWFNSSDWNIWRKIKKRKKK